MTTKHTKGPWHVGVKQAEKIVYDARGWAIANATVYHGKNDINEVIANARLIAAAPELLEALQLVAHSGPLNNGMKDENTMALVRAAITKATGE